MGDADVDFEEEKMRMYRSITSRQYFPRQLQQFNLYYQDSKHQPQLQVVQEKGTLVIFGMLKIYWGTQKVIRLKKEELSWKRRSTRMAYENGLDEKLMSAMGSGAKTRRSLKLRDSFEATPDAAKEAVNDLDANGTSDSTNGHEGENGTAHEEDRRRDDRTSAVLSMTMPHRGRGNLNRRTMSFSGHLYKSNTAVFRPKYGTVSNVRVSSKHSTPEVIALLLRKFAVENSPSEFNLYEVMHHGESHEMKPMDFPLLKRVMLGPDEHVAKIFIMEKKTQEISPEIAQYINLQMPVLNAIIQKFNEEEERELLKIRQRYAQYKANLQKKMATITTDVGHHINYTEEINIVIHSFQPETPKVKGEQTWNIPLEDVQPQGLQIWRAPPSPLGVQPWGVHPQGVHPWNEQSPDVQPQDGRPRGIQRWRVQQRDVQPWREKSQDVQPPDVQPWDEQSKDVQPWGEQSKDVQPRDVQTWGALPRGEQIWGTQSWDVQPWGTQPHTLQTRDAQSPGVQSPVVLTDSNKKKKGFFGWRR